VATEKIAFRDIMMKKTVISKNDGNIYIAGVHTDMSDISDLIFTGWKKSEQQKNDQLLAYWNDEPCTVEILKNDGPVYENAFLGGNHESDGIIGRISFPDHAEKNGTIRIAERISGNPVDIFTQTGLNDDMFVRLVYFLDFEGIDENNVYRVKGWAVGPKDIKITVSKDGTVLPAKISWSFRDEIQRLFPETASNRNNGFEITLHLDKNISAPFLIKFESGVAAREELVTRRRESAMRAIHGPWYVRYPMKTALILKHEGFEKLISVVLDHLKRSDEVTYEDHIKRTEPSASDMEREKTSSGKFGSQPLFSVVVPMYRTKPRFLDELIQSFVDQTYPNWELCLADAGKDEAGVSPSEEQVKGWQQKDSRIRYKKLDKNLSIAENTNEAIAMAQGDWIVFSDHDDTVAPFALFMCARTINENPECDVIYSDQDMINYHGTKRYDPLYKPDYNEALFCSRNYISHLMLARKSLVDKVGGLNPDYDGSQDYDFTFRCCEAARQICHIPVVLYHWRAHQESTAGNPESKLYAFTNGAKAINDHYKRLGLPAEAKHTGNWGIYKTTFHWPDKPLVSILIPNKDHIDDLKRCIWSIEKKTTYPNYEIVVIENNSDQDETFQFYEELKQHKEVKVVYYKGGFNYSAINNFGARNANGEYLLLLNNDTEVITPEWLDEMMGYAQCPDVGIVGAKLLYPDETIQHAGVVVGYGGTAGHAFKGLKRDDYGYMARLLCAQDYLAVTGACLLTRKSVFEEVGCLNEDLAVAFNDIDYCLKVHRYGKRCVWTPYAELFHYESKSRGYETTPEKQERFTKETGIFTGNWRELIDKGDPYYNPNLTLGKEDFSFRNKNDAPVHFS
jgi:GT2 family glycosyltransferase